MLKQQFNSAASSFVTGVPVTHDSGWIVMAIDELAAQDIAHSAVLWFEQGALYSVCLQMFHSKHVAWLADCAQAVIVGDNGECCVVNKEGHFTAEFVTKSARNPRNTGHLRAATQLDSDVIAVGMQYQVYRRSNKGDWSDMMDGLPTSGAVGGFECVLAIATDEIYAAGWRGEIWRFDGLRWHPIASQSQLTITSLCLCADGNVRGCGQRGLLLEGRHETWRLVCQPVVNEDLWSIAVTGSACFIASLSSFYYWDRQGVNLFDSGDINGVGLLRAEGQLLWSFGQRNLLSFAAGRWHTLY